MPRIELHTEIQAPAKRCFNLARSIDLHTISTSETGEKAIAGRLTGLIKNGESVTWEARHLGIRQTLTSKITAFEPYTFFADEQVQGAFKSFRHEHRFIITANESTLMTDIFDYKSPLGLLGKLADIIFLKTYMAKLLRERNRIIKVYAENGQWQALPGMSEQD